MSCRMTRLLNRIWSVPVDSQIRKTFALKLLNEIFWIDYKTKWMLWCRYYRIQMVFATAVTNTIARCVYKLVTSISNGFSRELEKLVSKDKNSFENSNPKPPSWPLWVETILLMLFMWNSWPLHWRNFWAWKPEYLLIRKENLDVSRSSGKHFSFLRELWVAFVIFSNNLNVSHFFHGVFSKFSSPFFENFKIPDQIF